MEKLEAPVNRENICPSEKYGGDGIVMDGICGRGQPSLY